MGDIQKFLDDQLGQIKANLTGAYNQISTAGANAAGALNSIPKTQADIGKIADITDWLKKNLMYIIAGAGLLVVGVIFLVKRKK